MSSIFTFSPILTGYWCRDCNCPNWCGGSSQVIKDGEEAQGYAELLYGTLRGAGWDATIAPLVVMETTLWMVSWACNRESAITGGCKDHSGSPVLPSVLLPYACCWDDRHLNIRGGGIQIRDDSIHYLDTDYALYPSLNGVVPVFEAECTGRRLCKCRN